MLQPREYKSKVGAGGFGSLHSCLLALDASRLFLGLQLSAAERTEQTAMLY